MKNWHSKADISFYDNIWEHEFFHIIQGCTRLSVFWSHQENQQYIVQGWDIFLNKASELKINITVKCIMESSLWWPLIVWLHLYDSFFCENLPTIASPSHLIGSKSSDLRSTFFPDYLSTHSQSSLQWLVQWFQEMNKYIYWVSTMMHWVIIELPTLRVTELHVYLVELLDLRIGLNQSPSKNTSFAKLQTLSVSSLSPTFFYFLLFHVAFEFYLN